MRQSTRREMLALGGTATAIGLAGCLGNGDDTDDGSGDDGAGTGGGNGDDGHGTPAGLTLADTPRTGRYEFAVSGAPGYERFIWDVQETDGDEATVDVTIDLGSGFLEEETITVTPIIPEGFTSGRPLNETLDIDDLTNARFGDVWYPINQFANVDLSTLSVGDTWDESVLDMEVTGTDSHAGLDCLVVEASIFDELESRHCVSTEHAIVVRGERIEGQDEPISEVTLTSYDE